MALRGFAEQVQARYQFGAADFQFVVALADSPPLR
jgi:hypothetical protein